MRKLHLSSVAALVVGYVLTLAPWVALIMGALP